MSSYIAQQIINGIQLGAIYALIALGYSMVYGIIKLINFAHADIFMAGAYTAFFMIVFYSGASGTVPFSIWIAISLMCGYLTFTAIQERIPRLNPVLFFFSHISLRCKNRFAKLFFNLLQPLFQAVIICAIGACILPVVYYLSRALFSAHLGILLFPVILIYTMTVCGLFGAVMERVAYRPLRYRSRLSALITALGVSLFLENFCSLPFMFDTKYRAFPQLIRKVELFRIPHLDIGITNIFLTNIVVLAIMLGGLWYLVEKTLIGKQMRAVSFDKRTASLMGIDVDRIITYTFIIGPALAGVSGILYAVNYGILQSPFLGFTPGIKAFIAAVIGGIGSLPGAVIGAFIMGITEVFANSVDSNLGFAAAFVILIIILLLRPSGIMGKSHEEKV
jgi:branched-chain amino acid transport system permease protein